MVSLQSSLNYEDFLKMVTVENNNKLW